MVRVGTPIVRVVTVPSAPSPATFTACTLTATAVSSGNPDSTVEVAEPGTSLVPLGDSMTYLVTGRPLDGAARQLTWIDPFAVGTVAAARLTGAPGWVNGTIVLLGGEASLAALMSLIATTVNAYWVPYFSAPLASVMVTSATAPTGAVAP